MNRADGGPGAGGARALLRSAFRSFALLAWGSGGVACDQLGIVQDPMRRDAIALLGPEDPAVPVGPRHRPGQPCGTCHSDGGNAAPFAFAGTVYRDPASAVALADIVVSFIDGAGTRFMTRSNCTGNFYVKPTELVASGPVWVSVLGGDLPYTMESPIHREVSCAMCHRDPAGPASAGHVFVTDDDTQLAHLAPRACGAEDEVVR